MAIPEYPERLEIKISNEMKKALQEIPRGDRSDFIRTAIEKALATKRQAKGAKNDR